jgi:acetyltransferase-like isoleucine patch superfamily enzyme
MSPAVRLHQLVPGGKIAGDWFAGETPRNIIVGPNCLLDSTFTFKQYFSKAAVGLRLGRDVTLWRTSLATEAQGVIEIGDQCFLANASLVCAERISIGHRVMIAGGVTIVDSDFHPLSVLERVGDTVALSLRGDRHHRPPVTSRPVHIEDDVWIGWNATILKGVRVGAGSVISPGAVVTRDVPPGVEVQGNPARPVGAPA